jgi:hypothetical protein
VFFGLFAEKIGQPRPIHDFAGVQAFASGLPEIAEELSVDLRPVEFRPELCHNRFG